MVPRIQYQRALRLAQRQGPRSFLGQFQAAQPQQPFSTSLTRRQEPRHPPVSPESPASASAADPIPTPTEAAAAAEAPATTTTTTTTTPQQPQNQQQQEQKDKKKKPQSRLAPRLLLATAFTLLGFAGGSSLRLLLTPPPPPAPNTEEDAYTISVLHSQAARLPIVQELTALAAASPDTWESWDAYDSLPAAHRAQHITAGILAGSRGVGGFQRVWWNRATGEVVSVVYFGGATAGWPGVVHGGCLATILDESCGRAAFKEWGGRSGLTASLGLEYKRVTLANGFYVVRTRVRPEEELPAGERGKRHYKCWVDANIEDAVTGAVTVVAEALFVGGTGKNGNGTLMGGKVSEKHARF